MVMQRVSDPATAQRLMKQVEDIGNQDVQKRETIEITNPSDVVFPLGGWYQQDGGGVATTFEVRELTGRDEEYIGKARDVPRMLIAILERGLVKVGTDKASSDVLDGLLAGDWETVLLAIRLVTFGPIYNLTISCQECGGGGETEIDLRDIPIRKVAQSEQEFRYTGRHDTEYRLCPVYGAVQRKIMMANATDTVAEMNTVMLKDCVTSIGGRPVISKSDVLDIPLSDRRSILQEIDKRRSGPDLTEVKAKCPECGEEQSVAISLVAVFQN